MIPVDVFAKDTALNPITDKFNRKNFAKVDLEDFQARAEELRNYNLAYEELLKTEYKRQIERAIKGEECVSGFDLLFNFENDLMEDYRYWDKFHNNGVTKLDPWGGKDRVALLGMLRNVLDSTPANKMAMAAADLKNGAINIDGMLSFTRSNITDDTVSVEHAQTMVSYAQALADRNKNRSFWKMLGNLGLHFQEKRAIREMRAAAEKSGLSLYELERSAHKNPDFVEMEKSDLAITRAPKKEAERMSVDLNNSKAREIATELGTEAKKTFEKSAKSNDAPKINK